MFRLVVVTYYDYNMLQSCSYLPLLNQDVTVTFFVCTFIDVTVMPWLYHTYYEYNSHVLF